MQVLRSSKVHNRQTVTWMSQAPKWSVPLKRADYNIRPPQAMMTLASDLCCCTSLVYAEVTVESNPRTQSPTTATIQIHY
uniref:Uncharacterized protein n=1 Tax=Arion vulgaris TaxID=1028688 RepID=A0A0B7AM59_9EUPU